MKFCPHCGILWIKIDSKDVVAKEKVKLGERQIETGTWIKKFSKKRRTDFLLDTGPIRYEGCLDDGRKILLFKPTPINNEQQSVMDETKDWYIGLIYIDSSTLLNTNLKGSADIRVNRLEVLEV